MMDQITVMWKVSFVVVSPLRINTKLFSFLLATVGFMAKNMGSIFSHKLVETKTRAKREWILDKYSLGGHKHDTKSMIMLFCNC